MSALYGIDNSRTADGPPPPAMAGRIDGSCLYLTDEVFLYRVAGVVASGVSEMIELEDCYGLDIVCIPLRDLRARRLRVVRPAAVED